MLKKNLKMLIVIVLITTMLSACFPTKDNNYSINKNNDFEKINIEKTMALNGKHIAKRISDNFCVDADVNLNIYDDLATYKACGFDISMEKCVEALEPDGQVLTKYEDEYMEYYTFDDESEIIKYAYRNGQKSIIFKNKKYYSNRNIEWLYRGSNNYNGRLNYEKDKIWDIADLSFMPNDKACEIVRAKVNMMGITANDYKAYAVDITYLNKKQNWFNDNLFEGEESVSYTKEDEFYLVVCKITMPNDAILADTVYQIGEDGDIEVDSATVYAIVNKMGIIFMECSGIFTDISKMTDNDKIISVNDALSTITDFYKEVDFQEPIKIENIELAYVPYISNEEGKFELKPTWIFYFSKTCQDGTVLGCCRYIDAIEGERIVESNEELF